jgi:F0F1-type ATP synthase assembly protein I
MPGNHQSPRQTAYYFALSQVGFEMAAPIGVGYLVDLWLGVFPWLTISGAILGLVGGLYHLVALTKNPPKDGASEESDS